MIEFHDKIIKAFVNLKITSNFVSQFIMNNINSILLN